MGRCLQMVCSGAIKLASQKYFEFRAHTRDHRIYFGLILKATFSLEFLGKMHTVAVKLQQRGTYGS